MTRLTEDSKENRDDLSHVPRVDVWINRIRKDSKPVNLAAADTIEKLKKVDSGSHSGSTINYREDVLSQVLGPDRSGRLREMERDMTFTMAIWSHVRVKQTIQMQNEIAELRTMVYMLKKNQGNESWGEASTHQKGKHDKKHDTCNLLDWCETNEIVAEGKVLSSDPKELVQQIPLGSDEMKIIIDISRKPDAFLWRPTLRSTHIGEVEGEIVAWPVSRVVLHNIDHFEKEDNASKISSMDHKCKLLDWSGNEEIIVEGRLHSSNLKGLVNDLPLGPSTMAVWVDNPKNQDAYLWRPTIGLARVGEAVGMKVAWPESRVVVEQVNNATFSSHIIELNVVEKSVNDK